MGPRPQGVSRSPQPQRPARRGSREGLRPPLRQGSFLETPHPGGVRLAPGQRGEPREAPTPPGPQPGSRCGCASCRGCGSGSGRAAACASFAAAAPRPRAPDLSRQWPPGRSQGHMAEGDAGSDQRQVRPRRGADLQARLGLASPSRASSAEGPSTRGRPGAACTARAAGRDMCSTAFHFLGAFFRPSAPAGLSRASAGRACLGRCPRQANST